LDIAGLSFDEFKDRSPFTLSGGEKRKVALASVIVCDPEVLILDEPSAGLDGASKKAFWIGCGVTAIAKERLSLLPIRWKKLWLLKGYWCSPTEHCSC